MWKLVTLGERGSPFTELGSYANLGDAARAVLKTENDPIKYLLKRAQTNRNAPLRFTVINHYPRKPKSEIDPERGRYHRFLENAVNSKSFEDFVADPLAVLRA